MQQPDSSGKRPRSTSDSSTAQDAAQSAPPNTNTQPTGSTGPSSTEPAPAPTCTLLLDATKSSEEIAKLFTPFDPTGVKMNYIGKQPSGAYIQFRTPADASLALEVVGPSLPLGRLRYCKVGIPTQFDAFRSVRLGQADVTQWCRDAGVQANYHGDTLQLTLTDPSSNSTVPDALFPLSPSTGEHQTQFYTTLRGLMRQENNVFILPVYAIVYAMLADKNEWTIYTKIKNSAQRTRCISRRLKRVFGTDNDTTAAWTVLIENQLHETLFKKLIEMLETETKGPEVWDKPLRELLQDPNFLTQNTALKVVTKNEYTDDPEWQKHLPPYWVCEDDRLLSRARRPVFSNLVMTDSLSCLHKLDVAQQVILIDGESGSGKTCALFSSACGSKAEYDLHFVTTASRLFPGMTCSDVIGRVRGYVHAQLRDLLARSQNNTAAPLRVLLYIDEVGANLVNGIYVVSGISEYMPELIKKFGALQQTAIVGTDREAVSISITVVAAGTGIEDMYGGDGGSIAGHYTTLRMAALGEEKELRAVVAKYIENRAVDEVMRCEEMRVIGSNARFLAYTLQQLQQLIIEKCLDCTVNKSYVTKALSLYAKRSPDSLGIVPEKMSTLVRRLLPEACAYAASTFAGANGLLSLTPMERQVLIQAAHVAYLKRVVLVSGKDEKALQGVEAGLRGAGFTPMRRPKKVDAYDCDVNMVVTASAAGLYSTTKVAGTLSSDHVAAGCEWDEDGATRCVMVPTGKPPIVMSSLYRVLPRMFDRSLFMPLSPDGFEEVSTGLIYEALNALATHEGGCDYPTLLAAVMGPDYRLPWATATAAATTKRLIFHRVVRVRLGFRLGEGEDTSRRVLSACAAALETHLTDWLASCSGMQGAASVSERLASLKGANTVEEKREYMQRVMFVVTPLPQSPSPDGVLMCVSNGNGEGGYLGVMQFKRNFKEDPPEATMEKERAKNGDEGAGVVQNTKKVKTKEQPATTKETKQPATTEETEEPTTKNIEKIKQRGRELRKELEACSAPLSDEFFIFWKKPQKAYFANSPGTVSLHVHAPRLD